MHCQLGLGCFEFGPRFAWQVASSFPEMIENSGDMIPSHIGARDKADEVEVRQP